MISLRESHAMFAQINYVSLAPSTMWLEIASNFALSNIFIFYWFSVTQNSLKIFFFLNDSFHYHRNCEKNGKIIIDWPIEGKYTMTCNACYY